MSTKRTSPEDSDEEETSDASKSLVHLQHSAKRVKLTSVSDKTLQDLPIELLESILIKTVAMEVKCMKLARKVWTSKVDLVIDRLKTVCSQWTSILVTNIFRCEVQRILDGTALEKIRLEILHQSQIQLGVIKVIGLKDEIFMLYRDQSEVLVLNVYNRNNLVEVKDVIPLPGLRVSAMGLAACNVSNSLYAINLKYQTTTRKWRCPSAWRIGRDEEQKFCVYPWISKLNLPLSSVSVSADGSVIIFSEPGGKENLPALRIYNGDASLQHKISVDMNDFMGDHRVLKKSNGNLVLASHTEQFQTQLTEFDLTGRIIRQYLSSVGDGFTSMKSADIYGRILISDVNGRMKLLDSEFNLLAFSRPQLPRDKFDITYDTHFNIDRNEIVGVAQQGCLTIFRFTDQ